ncbi:unnamed protein product [Paramecium primaurelia]|uniref:Uncharacterized protein n=1 Tax=Paramecium primaurelia TaxID=5886 RepID=A0A8S1MRY0_PARPR|nr:unnamed protein product [Paramecium primaurelia]
MKQMTYKINQTDILIWYFYLFSPEETPLENGIFKVQNQLINLDQSVYNTQLTNQVPYTSFLNKNISSKCSYGHILSQKWRLS